MNKLQQARFLQSAAKLEQLPADNGTEIAFAGRSNAGKSTAINAITGIKGLAKTSKTPGRTQLINLFTIDEQHRLVDLPGYGYAAVPQETKERWQRTLNQYLQERQCLRGLILLMDIRHPLRDFDLNMIHWAHQSQLQMYILLTKADKLSRGAAMTTLKNVQKKLAAEGYKHNCQLFSVNTNIGIDTARKKIVEWFYTENK